MFSLFVMLIIPILLIYGTICVAVYLDMGDNLMNPRKFFGVLNGSYLIGRGYLRELREEEHRRQIRDYETLSERMENDKYKDTTSSRHSVNRTFYINVMYYVILGVPNNSSRETCERAYRSLAMKYHPDNQITGNSEKMRMLNEAIDIIRKETA